MNTVVVYRSRREQIADEFWMSEDGQDIQMVFLFFVIAVGLGLVLYEKIQNRLRQKSIRSWDSLNDRIKHIR